MPGKSFADLYPEVAKEWHPTLNGTLTASQVAPASSKIVWWQCPRGHEWQAQVAARRQYGRCMECQAIERSEKRKAGATPADAGEASEATWNHLDSAFGGARAAGGVPLEPAKEAGSGTVHDPEMVALAEVIEKINDLFSGDHPDSGVRNVVTHIKDRLEESETLQQQAQHNTLAQFSASPDLHNEFLGA